MTPLSLAIAYRSAVSVRDPRTTVWERLMSEIVHRTREEAGEVTRQRAEALRRLPGMLPPDVNEEPPLPVLVVALPEGLVDGLGMLVPAGTLQVVQLGDIVRFAPSLEPT